MRSGVCHANCERFPRSLLREGLRLKRHRKALLLRQVFGLGAGHVGLPWIAASHPCGQCLGYPPATVVPHTAARQSRIRTGFPFAAPQ